MSLKLFNPSNVRIKTWLTGLGQSLDRAERIDLFGKNPVDLTSNIPVVQLDSNLTVLNRIASLSSASILSVQLSPTTLIRQKFFNSTTDPIEVTTTTTTLTKHGPKLLSSSYLEYASQNIRVDTYSHIPLTKYRNFIPQSSVINVTATSYLTIGKHLDADNTVSVSAPTVMNRRIGMESDLAIHVQDNYNAYLNNFRVFFSPSTAFIKVEAKDFVIFVEETSTITVSTTAKLSAFKFLESDPVELKLEVPLSYISLPALMHAVVINEVDVGTPSTLSKRGSSTAIVKTTVSTSGLSRAQYLLSTINNTPLDLSKSTGSVLSLVKDAESDVTIGVQTTTTILDKHKSFVSSCCYISVNSELVEENCLIGLIQPLTYLAPSKAFSSSKLTTTVDFTVAEVPVIKHNSIFVRT